MMVREDLEGTDIGAQTPDAERQARLQQLEALADNVRQVSRAAHVIRLDEAWAETEDELSALLQDPDAADYQDLAMVHEGDHTYLYSTAFMTEQYATVAARKEEGDPVRMIAETVRYDSETYPRPTQLQVFELDPYILSPDEALDAVKRMSEDPRYADIKLIRASDGTPYLFSAGRMHPDHAQSLAEWFSVGQFNSP